MAAPSGSRSPCAYVSRQDGRPAEPRVVFRDRPVAVDADDAAGEVPADVGVVGEIVLDAVEVRVVEAEAIGAGDEQRAVRRQHDAALAAAVEDDLDVLQAPVVLAQPRPGHPLHPDVHRPAFGERFGPDLFVEGLEGPHAGRLAARRREVGEVEHPVAGEVRIEHDVVQALRADHLDAGHAGNRQRDETVGPDDPHRADALGDEEVAVGQKRDRPRAAQPVGDGLDRERRRRLRRRRRVGLSRKRRLGERRLRPGSHQSGGRRGRQRQGHARL